MTRDGPPCSSEKEETSYHTLTCAPLWDEQGNLYKGSIKAYHSQLPLVLSRRGPHDSAYKMHEYARARPGVAFYTNTEKKVPLAARRAAEAYPGDKTSVTELSVWLTTNPSLGGLQDRDEVAKFLMRHATARRGSSSHATSTCRTTTA